MFDPSEKIKIQGVPGITIEAEDGTECVPLIEGLKGFYPPDGVAKLVPKVDRTFGNTKASFGAKAQWRGYKIINDEAVALDTGKPPNRKTRRFMQAYNSAAPKYKPGSKAQKKRYEQTCKEKRQLKQAIKQSRFGYVLRHAPHPSYWGQYLPEEELVRLKEGPPEELEAAKRFIKNTRKRYRRG